jgi:hypothetical protein
MIRCALVTKIPATFSNLLLGIARRRCQPAIPRVLQETTRVLTRRHYGQSAMTAVV